jgi:hypothetical protein
MWFFSLFFYKMGEQEGRIGPAWGGGWVPVGKGKRQGEGCKEVNIGKYCVHTYANGKMRPVDTVLGMGVGDKEE